MYSIHTGRIIYLHQLLSTELTTLIVRAVGGEGAGGSLYVEKVLLQNYKVENFQKYPILTFCT